MNRRMLLSRLKRLMRELAATERVLRHYLRPPTTAANVRRATERVSPKRKQKRTSRAR